MTRPGTVAHALLQPDGTAVYLDAVVVDKIRSVQNPPYFVVREPFNYGSRIVVDSMAPSQVRTWQTLDISGTMTTLANGERALSGAGVIGYFDSSGNLLMHGPLIKGILGPTPWQWKMELSSSSVPGASVMSLDPPPPGEPTAAPASSPVFCSSIAEAKERRDTSGRVLVELGCRPMRSLGTNSFILEEDRSDASITVYHTDASSLSGRVSKIIGTIDKSSQGSYFIEVDTGPNWNSDSTAGIVQTAAEGTIAWAKTFTDGYFVSLQDKTVSAVFGSQAFYLEEPDRSSAIKVVYPQGMTMPSEGDTVSIPFGKMKTGESQREISPVSWDISPNSGWTVDGSSLIYSGTRTAGSASISFAVDPNDIYNPSREYELAFSVKVDAHRQLNQDWPSPWVELGVNGQTHQSKRFFGDNIWRRRRVRFYVEPGTTTATFTFKSDASCTAQTQIRDFCFRPVDSIPRDNTLGVPYTGYNFATPPGGGLVDGWTAESGTGYNNDDMDAWINTVKQPDKPMLVRVFVNLDQGMANFDDDTWAFQNNGQVSPEAQYQNDPPPPGVSYSWVTDTGEGYRLRDGLQHGFSDAYVSKIDAFLSRCENNDIKVIAVLYLPYNDWTRVPIKGTTRGKAFRKTTFDQAGDYLRYSNAMYKYKCDYEGSPALKDHSQMRNSYLDAIEDWLDLFGEHSSLWGMDFFNEPQYFLGSPFFYGSDISKIWTWHGAGRDTFDPVNGVEQWVDGCHQTHRLRDFLAEAYSRVKTWSQQNGRDIKVVCDIDDGHHQYPRDYIDMAHPWDTTDPYTVRKVCDVFGMHWYQKHQADASCNPVLDGSNNPLLDWTQLWCSDRLQPWRHPEEGAQSVYHIDPLTDWMAEKPIIVAEIHRYEKNDHNRIFKGDEAFEDNDDGTGVKPNNSWWYDNLLDKGISRHIESLVFWSGDGGGSMKHLVEGTPVDVNFPYWEWGWGSVYTIGHAGSRIKSYVLDPD